MAEGRNMSYTSCEGEGGQAQMKRDDCLYQAPNAQAAQHSSYTEQATNLFQQTGEQMMNMAHGAADAVKNTLGMNPSSNPSNAPGNNPTTRI